MGEVVSIADRVYFYDNSADGEMPKLLFRSVDGKLFKQYTNNIPEWAQILKEKVQL